MPKKLANRSAGITLIELLIVIACIALLVQLVLPAIGASREAARQTQCMNNLRQITFAIQSHHATHGYFPTGGWGWQWVGHPDRGYGEDQPGGWAYNLLPFIEQQVIREIGSGLPEGSRQQQLALLSANATPIPLFHCPSRRPATVYPMVATGYVEVGFSPLLPEECRNGDGEKCKVARSDYAINGGSLNPGTEPGPNSLEEAESWDWRFSGSNGKAKNGISNQRSKVRIAEVTDGLGKTYCVGEKYIPVDLYENGKYQNDDLSIFVGYDEDMNRYTADIDQAPRKITPDTGLPNNQHFGSAHSQVFHMSFCDGSVQPLSYEIDPETHRLLGGRNDGVGDVPSR